MYVKPDTGISHDKQWGHGVKSDGETLHMTSNGNC